MHFDVLSKDVKEAEDVKKHAVALIVFTSFAFFTSLLITSVLFYPSVQAQSQAPVFRGGVDLRQLDVTVLDKQRRPIRGLTAADFTLTEDGVPQKIESFSFVDVPDVPPAVSAPVWGRRVVADVETNDTRTSRAFALVVDDGGAFDLWARRELPKSVATFMSQLNQDDLVSLTFIREGERSQNFTHDKARIMAAADRLPDPVPHTGGICPTSSTMKYVAENLATFKNLRKAIVYFGNALHFDTSAADPCGLIWSQFVQIANENNVTAYAVDTMGLRPGSQRSNDEYLELAHHTGGRAVINTNAFEEGLTAIVAENTSYYLLAYQPVNSAADGRFRRVQVHVDRPGVDVVATRNYWAPRPVPAAAAKPSVETAALAGVLPVSELPLRATAAAFGTGESGGAVLVMAVALQQPPFGARTRDQLDVLATAFTPNGTLLASDRRNVVIAVPAARPGADASRYEALSRLNVRYPFPMAVSKAGSYELRLSVTSEATGRQGSVYVSVDVPDFQQDALSLSGVILNDALSGTPSAPAGALREIVPFAPTTNRNFKTADIITAFLRVYTGTNEKAAAIPLKVTIQDALGKTVFDKSESLPPDRFSADRAADYQFRLPVATLKSGEYLLTFEAGAGKVTAKRDVRFAIK